MTDKKRHEVLKDESPFYFGYPEMAFDPGLAEAISQFFPYHINNVGDPWDEGNWKMHAKQEEQSVLQFMAEFYEIDNFFWGHLTTGGTEGNLAGAYLGRKFLEKAQKEIVLVTSETAHYSLFKIADIMQLPLIVVDSDEAGRMKLDDFKLKIDLLRNKSLLVINTIGTTMTGAIDPFSEIASYLKSLGISHYIHADAALHGGFYPFMRDYQNPFQHGVSSLSISGHKFFGTLRPCGIFLTNKNIREELLYNHDKISYINCLDSTITGSRDGLSALILKYILDQKGLAGLKKSYQDVVEKAYFLARELKNLEWPDVLHLPEQPIVVFRQPSAALCAKYQLALHDGLGHVVLKESISFELIKMFLTDLSREK